MSTPRKKNVKPEAVNKSNDRLGIYKEQYYFELKRKDSLGKELTLPVGVITLLIGAASYFTEKFDHLHPLISPAFYAILLLLISLSIVGAIYYLIRSNYGHKFECVPTSKLTEEYYEQLMSYYKELGQDSEIEPSFEKFLINTYGKCNEINITSNDSKAAYLHNARTAIIVAIIFSAMTLLACNFETTEKILQAIVKK